MRNITITEISETHLGDVAQMHADLLWYSFNSKLGINHLKKLYKILALDTKSIVLVALDEDSQPIGFISGMSDLRKLKRLLIFKLGFVGWMNILYRCLIKPPILWNFFQHLKLFGTVESDGKEVIAGLLSFGVLRDKATPITGLLLMKNIIQNFSDEKITRLCSHTKSDNIVSLVIHKRCGFKISKQYKDNTVLINEI